MAYCRQDPCYQHNTPHKLRARAPTLPGALVSFMRLSGGLFRLEKHPDLRDSFVQHSVGHAVNPLRTPNSPVKALDLISQHNSLNPQTGRKRHLEWIPLPLRSDWTQQCEPHPAVVGGRGQDQRGPLAGLLMTGLRIELQPDNVTTPRDVALGHYQISRPTG